MRRWLLLLIPFVLFILITKGSENVSTLKSWWGKVTQAPTWGDFSWPELSGHPKHETTPSYYDPARGRERTILPQRPAPFSATVTHERVASPQGYNLPQFQMPDIPMMSLDDMMKIINRRVDLLINPQIEGLRRGIEEERAAHGRRVGETRAGYEEVREGAVRGGQESQRMGASAMRKRGIYDSGMAQDLAKQIQASTREAGLKIDTEQARALADLSEYLNLRERHTEEQIQGLMGQRGEWAQSLLDEMQQQQQSRQDMLEQRAFENWLAQQQMQHQIWRQNQAAMAAAQQAAQPQTPGWSDLEEQMRMAAYNNLMRYGAYGQLPAYQQQMIDPILWRQMQEQQLGLGSSGW